MPVSLQNNRGWAVCQYRITSGQLLLLGYTLYKAKPVEKERERGE